MVYTTHKNGDFGEGSLLALPHYPLPRKSHCKLEPKEYTAIAHLVSCISINEFKGYNKEWEWTQLTWPDVFTSWPLGLLSGALWCASMCCSHDSLASLVECHSCWWDDQESPYLYIYIYIIIYIYIQYSIYILYICILYIYATYVWLSLICPPTKASIATIQSCLCQCDACTLRAVHITQLAHMYELGNVIFYTLWWFNMAIENGHL